MKLFFKSKDDYGLKRFGIQRFEDSKIQKIQRVPTDFTTI